MGESGVFININLRHEGDVLVMVVAMMVLISKQVRMKTITKNRNTKKNVWAQRKTVKYLYMSFENLRIHTDNEIVSAFKNFWRVNNMLIHVCTYFGIALVSCIYQIIDAFNWIKTTHQKFSHRTSCYWNVLLHLQR